MSVLPQFGFAKVVQRSNIGTSILVELHMSSKLLVRTFIRGIIQNTIYFYSKNNFTRINLWFLVSPALIVHIPSFFVETAKQVSSVRHIKRIRRKKDNNNNSLFVTGRVGWLDKCLCAKVVVIYDACVMVGCSMVNRNRFYFLWTWDL